MLSCSSLRGINFLLFFFIFCFDFSFVFLIDTYSIFAAERKNSKTITLDESKDDLEFDESFFESDYSLQAEAHQSDATRYRLGGFIKSNFVYGFFKDNPKFTELKVDLNLAFDYRIAEHWKMTCEGEFYYDFAYMAYGRENFNVKTLDENETDADFREAFIDGKLNNWLSIKAGRQIIAWGESDSMQITDVVNSRDMLTPGLVALEDARLPVLSTKVSLFRNPWNLDIVSIHEIRTHDLAGIGDDFDTLKTLRSENVTIAGEHIPDSDLAHTEFAVRLAGRFNGGDMALVVADVYDDEPFLNLKGFKNLNERSYIRSGRRKTPRI